ncbi:MBL fold metallo-hydrolase [Bacillus salitolerans]|uniref:MBL fold metallo-hydrolase n=1 Tax=Bacillus salitolerans TaxID=1437434 RepID=A0ABW4LNN9_9BACI
MKKRYENLGGVQTSKSFSELRKWHQERKAKRKDLSVQIPMAETREVEVIQANRTKSSITWIGHASFLIQMNGLNILTDPVLAKRMGVQKRLTNPGLSFSELPEIDVVFISHGHYDHLDFGTIKKLKGAPTFYVPIGLRSAFIRRGYYKVVEANWWDQFECTSLTFSFVPAQHWTKRTLTDTNTSHWGGWIIHDSHKDNRTLYFVGDTGYFNGFSEIAARFNLDIVLMPIGAYEPEWFMESSHINPEDAIKAFLELRGKTFIPMHYGAYRLADDTGPEALKRLLHEWERIGIESDKLKVLAIGETYWL